MKDGTCNITPASDPSKDGIRYWGYDNAVLVFEREVVMNYNIVEVHLIVMLQERSRLLALPSLFHLFIHLELSARSIVVSSIHRYCDSDSTGANMRWDIVFRHHHGDVANIGPELHVAAIVYYQTNVGGVIIRIRLAS